MKNTVFLFIFIVASFMYTSIGAQTLKRANKHFDLFAYKEAIKLYEKIWSKDSSNYELARNLAKSYKMINNSEKAEEWYAKVINHPTAKKEDFYNYSKALQSNQKYDKARIWMSKYYGNQDKNRLEKLDRLSQAYISSLYQDSLRYKIFPVQSNSEFSDFGASFYKDQLVFSSAKRKMTLIKRNYKWNDQDYLRLYNASINDDGDVISPSLFSHELSTKFHDGPVCFNAKANEMFLTRNYVSEGKRAKRNKDGVVNIKLYHCKKEKNSWSKPKLLPFNLKDYSTGHPALSANGNDLYFISNRPGGIGGTDLYVSHREKNGWSKPKNLGNKINTPENEMFPFITKDNTLYFASKGHAGLGGLDLFSIDLDNKESIPVNVGYPINTPKDDFGLILKNGKGYFASNRQKGESFDDIYHFIIMERLITGIVYNSETNNIIGNSTVSLVDKDENIINELTTDSSGKFTFKLTKLNSYQIKSIKAGFTDGLSTLNETELADKAAYFVPIYQTPHLNINIGESFVLEDIYYDFDKSSIRPDAKIVLDKLVLIMNNNPNLKIELSSHTDSRGRDAYNLALSNRRAKAAVKYIIMKGISSKRIIAKGYGETKLVNQCSNSIKCNTAEHQANRRTMIKILDI